MTKNIALRLLLICSLFWPLSGKGEGESETSLFIESPRNFTFEIGHAWQSYPNYRAAPSQTTPTDGGHGVHLEFGWMPLQQFGKVVIGVAGSFFWLDSFTPESSAVRFWVGEIGPQLMYQLHFVPDQFLVPYGKVGMSFAWSNQIGAFSQHYQTSGITYGGGAALLLNTFDRRSGQTLDSTFGINATYLQVEYMFSKLAILEHREIRFSMRFEM